jgi:hypothetical protein
MKPVGLYFAVELNNIHKGAYTLEGVRRGIERRRLEGAGRQACAPVVTRQIAQNAHPIKILGEPSRDEFNASLARVADTAAYTARKKRVSAVIRVAYKSVLAISAVRFGKRRITEEDRHKCGQSHEWRKTGC